MPGLIICSVFTELTAVVAAIPSVFAMAWIDEGRKFDFDLTVFDAVSTAAGIVTLMTALAAQILYGSTVIVKSPEGISLFDCISDCC